MLVKDNDVILCSRVVIKPYEEKGRGHLLVSFPVKYYDIKLTLSKGVTHHDYNPIIHFVFLHHFIKLFT